MIFIPILEFKHTFIVLVNVVDRLFELNQFLDDSSWFLEFIDMFICILRLMSEILKVFVGLLDGLIDFHDFRVDSIEGFLDFDPVIVVFDSWCLHVLCGILFDVFQFHFYFGFHFLTVNQTTLLKGLLNFFNVFVDSLPVFI